MKKLNCFDAEFCLVPSRFVFQAAKETPSQAQRRETGPGKEGSAEEVALKAFKTAQETERQFEFEARVNKVRQLMKRWNALMKKLILAHAELDPSEEDRAESKSIDDQMSDLAEQFNAELDLNIDFSKSVHARIENQGKGLLMRVHIEDKGSDNLSPDKKSCHMTIGLRPDGTYETRADIYPDRSITYFDSRTGESSQYYLPGPNEDHPDRARFKKERGNRAWPSAE